jgi:CheY-like chemotaxis protein
LMSYLLRAFGHDVLTAADGEAGLEVARREAPDLIVCDIQLPKIQGMDVARQLKSHAYLKSIPLIAVTAFAMVGDRDKVLAAGFDGYIAKPIVPENFVQQVETFLPQLPEPKTREPETPAEIHVARRQDTRATILVVDDSPVNIELARSILEPNGYEVIQCASVREALAILRDTTPDLILSDVHMKEATGFDFIKVLKADPKLKQIPFVFISSTVWEERDRVNGITLGAVKFIQRPTDPQSVLSVIERCLEEWPPAERTAASSPDTAAG